MSISLIPNGSLVAAGYHPISDVDYNRRIRMMTAFVFYEFFITLDAEILNIWKQRITGATILFVLARYVPLITRIFILWTVIPIEQTRTSLLFINLCAIVFISTLRVYAVWSLNRWVFIPVLVSGLILPIVNIYLSASASILVSSKHDTTLVCQINIGSNYQRRDIHRRVLIMVLSRVAMLVSESLVLVLTWIRTFGVFRTVLKAKLRRTLITLLLRDGTLYFLAIVGINVIAIGFIIRTGDNFLDDFITSISSVLMCRFIFNLRKIYFRSSASNIYPAELGAGFSVEFVSPVDIVGPMGAPIGIGDERGNQRRLSRFSDQTIAVPQSASDPLMDGLRDIRRRCFPWQIGIVDSVIDLMGKRKRLDVVN
ncbi:hypothetical protein C8Q75DRAFT_731532 [Abortiporus biennis]|nr:hypothetical protein C8Q75DRAFT_731532 [Abortiporus biennis]